MSERVSSQGSNSTGPAMWPANPPVGIGTQLSLPPTPQNAMHIHFDPTLFPQVTLPAVLRLSEGDSTVSSTFGVLGLHSPSFSSLASGYDLILHENNKGDLIFTNYSRTGTLAYAGQGAIRFATTGDTNKRGMPGGPHDLERLTISGEGNIGIDLPPDSITGLGKPMDQLQLGGGSLPATFFGAATPKPGLTFYGGNRFEGLPNHVGGHFPLDYRYMAFNHYQDHVTGVGGRLQPIGGAGVFFGDDYNGHVQLCAFPWKTGDGLSDTLGGATLNLSGDGGLALWTDERRTGGEQYHHLFDVWRPGVGGWDSLRNVYGLFLHSTPVLIDSNPAIDNFTDLAHIHPNIGDGRTWMLAVNGPALFKEAYVNTDWPDYVFDSRYKLRPLAEVEKFIEVNHHLPGVPSAKEMAQTGIPLGKSEAKLMEKIEELTKYVIELDKKVKALEEQNQELRKEK